MKTNNSRVSTLNIITIATVKGLNNDTCHLQTNHKQLTDLNSLKTNLS